MRWHCFLPDRWDQMLLELKKKKMEIQMRKRNKDGRGGVDSTSRSVSFSVLIQTKKKLFRKDKKVGLIAGNVLKFKSVLDTPWRISTLVMALLSGITLIPLFQRDWWPAYRKYFSSGSTQVVVSIENGCERLLSISIFKVEHKTPL